MDEAPKKPVCPKCRTEVPATAKFCMNCGRRLGFGVMSENEIRAALKVLRNSSFAVTEDWVKDMVLNDIDTLTYCLRWVLGEEDYSPLQMVVRKINMSDKFRKEE